MLTTLLRPASAVRSSARYLSTTTARASQSFYTRDPIPPPVQYDPSYDSHRKAAHEWFDKEGYRAEGRIEWPVQWGDSDMFQWVVWASRARRAPRGQREDGVGG